MTAASPDRPAPDERVAVHELQNFVRAKRFDRAVFDDDSAFADWVLSRARAALAQSAPVVAVTWPTNHSRSHEAIASQPPAQEPVVPDFDAAERAADEYIDGYEMIGETEEGQDTCYVPTEGERELIRDAVRGLLADDEFVRAFAAPVAQPPAEWVAEAERLAVAYAEAANYSQDDPHVSDCRREHDIAFAALRAHLTAGGGR